MNTYYVIAQVKKYLIMEIKKAITDIENEEHTMDYYKAEERLDVLRRVLMELNYFEVNAVLDIRKES